MTWPPTTLNDTQLANARIIAQVGKGLGASARDIQIAIATALQESELLNIDHGDRDSLGLFQQRSGWAPAADRMDPYRSAAMFFQGGQDGQRGLLAFKQRDQLSLTQAAQAVQVSAYPNAYAKWESLAAKYMPDLGVGDSTAAAPGISENTPTAAPTTPVGVATGAVGVAAPTPVGAVAPSAVGATSPAAPAQIQPTRAQTVIAPTGPNTSEVMTRDRFNELFPDAAHTKQFSAATSRAADGRRSDLISNAMSYMGTPYVWGGNSRDGVDCIAEGSLIATRRGEVPIERVEVGDLVWTRRGWRMVLRSWLVRDDAEVVELRVGNRTLRGTAEHRVWTAGRGWIPLGEITGVDTLVLCRHLNESSSTGGPISATPTPLAPPTGPTSSATRGISTGPSGSTLTDPSRPGTRYTMSITTPSTTTSLTWLWSPWQIIAGRVQRLGASTASCASSAARSSSPSQTPVPSAGSAASSTSRTAPIARRGSGTWRVYDLTVEGEPEFFADGVLVHNCSGLIQQTYRAMGIDLPRLSSEQIRAGTPTAYKNLRPGDLIGWDLNNRNYGADHIALFVGNNQIIEAPRPGLYVRRRTLSAHEMQTALGAHFSELG